jgi:flagellar basal-body rod protein FlgB
METPQVALLRRAMQTYTWRMQAHASNIANLDTPDYQRLSVSFEEQLQDAIHRDIGERDLGAVKPDMVVEDRPALLEDELMELADTQMRTQLATRALQEHFDMLRTGITGRNG